MAEAKVIVVGDEDDEFTYRHWLKHCDELLKERMILSATEILREVKLKFPEEFAELDKVPLKGRRRTRAMNLIDWIKANYTRSDKAMVLWFQDERYILKLETVGGLHKEGTILALSAARSMIEVAMKRAFEEGYELGKDFK